MEWVAVRQMALLCRLGKPDSSRSFSLKADGVCLEMRPVDANWKGQPRQHTPEVMRSSDDRQCVANVADNHPYPIGHIQKKRSYSRNSSPDSNNNHKKSKNTYPIVANPINRRKRKSSSDTQVELWNPVNGTTAEEIPCRKRKLTTTTTKTSLGTQVDFLKNVDNAGTATDSNIDQPTDKRKRVPTCSKCKMHGDTEVLKGHKNFCPYMTCYCAKCDFVRKRQKIMAQQVALRRAQVLEEEKEQDRLKQLKNAEQNGTSTAHAIETLRPARTTPVLPPTRAAPVLQPPAMSSPTAYETTNGICPLDRENVIQQLVKIVTPKILAFYKQTSYHAQNCDFLLLYTLLKAFNLNVDQTALAIDSDTKRRMTSSKSKISSLVTHIARTLSLCNWRAITCLAIFNFNYALCQ